MNRIILNSNFEQKYSMEVKDVSKIESHQLLAKIGKRVLRPGGKEMTIKLVEDLKITPQDKIVEFAPGLGFTALLALKKHPKSYIGVEMDEKHVESLRNKITGENIRFIQGDAESTGLETESQDKIFGEAMLSMHANQRKSRIIKEASRILKKGGLYAIHELELNLKDIELGKEEGIQKDLALVSKVNARPLTLAEWSRLLEEEGFKIIKIERSPLRVLEPSRIIDDEGFFRALKIGMNVMTHPKARKRILEMRRTFKTHDKYLNAIAILAEKV